MSTLLKELCSKETWKKAQYFMGRKTFEDAKKPLTKKDILPIILAFIISIGIMIVIVILVLFLKYIGLPIR